MVLFRFGHISYQGENDLFINNLFQTENRARSFNLDTQSILFKFICLCLTREIFPPNAIASCSIVCAFCIGQHRRRVHLLLLFTFASFIFPCAVAYHRRFITDSPIRVMHRHFHYINSLSFMNVLRAI